MYRFHYFFVDYAIFEFTSGLFSSKLRAECDVQSKKFYQVTKKNGKKGIRRYWNEGMLSDNYKRDRLLKYVKIFDSADINIEWILKNIS